MPSNCLILCCPLLFLPSIFPSIKVFSNELVHIVWPEYWSFSFIICPFGDYSRLISFRMDWFDLAVQGTLWVFSNITVQKHQFFSTQLSLWSNSHIHTFNLILPRSHSGKESTCQCRRHGVNPWVERILWSRKWQPAPVFLPEEFHGQRSWQATVYGVAKSRAWLSDWTQFNLRTTPCYWHCYSHLTTEVTETPRE